MYYKKLAERNALHFLKNGCEIIGVMVWLLIWAKGVDLKNMIWKKGCDKK